MMSVTVAYGLKFVLVVLIGVLLFIDLRKYRPINILTHTHGAKIFYTLIMIMLLWVANSAIRAVLNGEDVKTLVLIIFISLGVISFLWVIYIFHFKILWDDENIYVFNPFYFWTEKVIPFSDIVSIKQKDSRISYLIKTEHHGKIEVLMFMYGMNTFVTVIEYHIRQRKLIKDI